MPNTLARMWGVVVGPERYFFELPIHRVTEHAFGAQYRRDLDAFISSIAVPPGHVISEELRQVAEHHFWEHYGMPWQYNQVVGWLRLFVLGSQIRGDLWKARGTRLHRTGRRDYRCVGKAFELWCHKGQSSDEIVASLEAELRDVANGQRRGYSLDLECFATVAPYIDWHRLVFGSDGASG